MEWLNKLKNSKGFSSLEIAIGAFIMIMVLGTFVDLTNVLLKFNTISQTSSYISRTIADQGGVRTSKPNNFSGEYIGSADLYDSIKSSFDAVGISENDWTLKINGVKVQKTTNLSLVDFGNKLTMSLSVDYGWPILSNFLPGNLGGTKIAERSVISTYKIRTGGMSSSY